MAAPRRHRACLFCLAISLTPHFGLIGPGPHLRPSLAAARLAASNNREPQKTGYCSTSAKGTTMKCEAPVTVVTAF